MPTLELRDLERALAKLPHEQREVILLVGLEGMRYDQVAEILNVPIGTVALAAIAWTGPAPNADGYG